MSADTFDPMFDAPQNDEQAMIFLRHERDAFTGDNLCGLYQTYRGQGASVADACRRTLTVLLDMQTTPHS